MTIEEKREKLHGYINSADDKQIDAIFSIVADGIEDNYDHWEDKEFLAEIKSMIDDFENGVDEGLSWEQVKLNARKTRQEKTVLMEQAASDPLFLEDLKSVNDDFNFVNKDI